MKKLFLICLLVLVLPAFACANGLCIERLVLEYPKGQENIYRSSDALLIVEKEDGYSLVGGSHYNGLLRPLKQAIVKSEIPLRYSQDETTPVMTLQAGAELHVLFADADGWLHVVVPTAPATRCMDINGTYGYVRLEEVDARDVILP